MHIAFALYKYFPFGGLQRSFRIICEEAVSRGHQVTIYTTSWQGDKIKGAHLNILKIRGFSNHGKMQQFHKTLMRARRSDPQGILIGFNKMPDLDYYYGADNSFVAASNKNHHQLFKLTLRYKVYSAFEDAVFNPDSPTRPMMISNRQQNEYQSIYQTPNDRFIMLPPGLAKDRVRPQHAQKVRAQKRQQLGFKDQHFVLLLVATKFGTKGLDRAIASLAALPSTLKTDTRLIVIGNDDRSPYVKMARELGVTNQVFYLGETPEIMDYMCASDLLVHPAYQEAAGNVLLEAMICGLPILTTEICGYSPYIMAAECGKLIHDPFIQTDMNTLLEQLLDKSLLNTLQQNALDYAATQDFYHRGKAAMDAIELDAKQANRS